MPVIIYGIGNMGRAVASILLKNDIEVICFIDKSVTFRKNINIDHIEILAFNPEETTHLDHNCDVIVSMSAAPMYEVTEYLNKLGFYLVYPAGDRVCELISKIKLTNVWYLSQYQYSSIIDIDFDDEISLLHWKIACEWFQSRSEKTVKESCFRPDRKKYLIPLVMNLLKKGSIMIDSALLDGEYSKLFVEMTQGHSYAFKLHPESECNHSIPNIIIDERELFSCKTENTRNKIGLMYPFTERCNQKVNTISIDEYCDENDLKPNFIRVYSMNEVLDIIIGANETIRQCRPIIAVNIGHYLIDFITVPYYVKLFFDNYKFFFRVHSFQGNDCILYAVPKEDC